MRTSSNRPRSSPTAPSPSRSPTGSGACWRNASRITRLCTGTGSGSRPQPPTKAPMLQQYDERNRDLLVNINGELIHRDRAGVSPFDSAVRGGDAVWEGLRLYDGRIFRLVEHL